MTPKNQRPKMDEMYRHYKSGEKKPVNINLHMDILYRLASMCKTVTELGSDIGFSTCAFLYAEPEMLVSIDKVRKPEMDTLDGIRKEELSTNWWFRQEDANTADIDHTDLLFIDADHRYEEMKAQLAKHASKVNKYLVFHDSVDFGEKELGSDNEGIWRAISEFCRNDPSWILLHHFEHQYGLTVLARIDAFVCGQPASSPPPEPKTVKAKPTKVPAKIKPTPKKKASGLFVPPQIEA